MPGSKPHDLTGLRFGRLVAQSIVGRKNKKAAWECQCDCGRTHVVASDQLKSGKTVSCGCKKSDVFRHLNSEQVTHGQSYTTEYKIWQGMHQRCGNPKSPGFRNYGGRGIAVCSGWESFDVFLRDMGPRPSRRYTLDRVDNNGPYCKVNCEWRTATQQQRNKRNTLLLTVDGITRPLSEWAEIVGIPHQTIRTRIRKGWSHRSAVMESNK